MTGAITTRALAACAAILLAFSASAATAYAQRGPGSLEQRFDPTQDIGIDQRLGSQLPLATTFQDETGATVQLDALFEERPVLLAFVYYECPMLCTLVINGLLDVTRVLTLAPGADYELVLVSIDPDEDARLAAAAKETFVASLGRPAAAPGIHFLTGSEEAIDELASAAGFRFVYDARADEYAHASAIMVATPDGVMSRYLYGVEFSARDLRLGLVEAADGEIGSLVDQVLLLCYRYDPASGQYGFAIMTTIRVLGSLTLILLVGFIVRSLRRDRRARRVSPELSRAGG